MTVRLSKKWRSVRRPMKSIPAPIHRPGIGFDDAILMLTAALLCLGLVGSVVKRITVEPRPIHEFKEFRRIT